jgi:PHP family Zn ribbon phosphoesterase
MTPREIVAHARERGLHIIAITDHNSAENVEAATRVASGTGLLVLAGMEIASSEEVHILGLFESPDQARCMQDMVYAHLPSGENDERLYGHQIVVNEENEVLGFNKKLLIGATDLSAHTIVDLIRSFGGISVASHIDREAFSVLSQLGFIPEDLRFDAVELSPLIRRDEAEKKFDALRKFPSVSFSDAHHVRDIGRRTTTFTMKAPTFYEIRQAFSRSEGRGLFWD